MISTNDAAKQLLELLSRPAPIAHFLGSFIMPGVEEKDLLDPHAVADFLKSTAATLGEMGIAPLVVDQEIAPKSNYPRAAHVPDPLSDAPWSKLLVCLADAVPEDALIIFKAVAQTLEGRSFAQCINVMKIALASEWRHEAIQSCPEFFTKPPDLYQVQPSEAGNAGSQLRDDYAPENALQVLASTPLKGGASVDDVRLVIQDLKTLGIQDVPDQRQQYTCLHFAALHQSSNGFRAFLSEFPELMEAANSTGRRPLHCLVTLGHPEDLQMLLDAGADPRAVRSNGTTALTIASRCGRIDCLKVLINTGVYTDSEVYGAISVGYQLEVEEELRAFYAGVKARQAIGVDGEHRKPRPL